MHSKVTTHGQSLVNDLSLKVPAIYSLLILGGIVLGFEVSAFTLKTMSVHGVLSFLFVYIVLHKIAKKKRDEEFAIHRMARDFSLLIIFTAFLCFYSSAWITFLVLH